MKTKRFLKKYFINLFLHSGLLIRKLNSLWTNSALILAYHRVNTPDFMNSSKIKEQMYISTESLNDQLKWIKQNFNVVPLSELVTTLKYKKEFSKPLCSITFDDGWYDNYEHAYPILRHYDLPATIFLIGSKIGSHKPYIWDMSFELIQRNLSFPKNLTGLTDLDKILNCNMKNLYQKARAANNAIRLLTLENFIKVNEIFSELYAEFENDREIYNKYRMLSYEEIKEMQDNKIEFGYHSHSHFMLDRLDKDKLYSEIRLPRSDEKINYKKLFCYPDGKHTDNTIDVLKELNYLAATSLVQGYNNFGTNLFKLKRFNIHDGNSRSMTEFQYFLTLTNNIL